VTLKACHDAKIGTGAAKGPQQVWVALRINIQNLAIRSNDTGGKQIVAGRSMKSRQPTQAAPKRYPGSPNTRALPEYRSQPITSRHSHDFTTQHSCIDAASVLGRVDRHTVHSD
jgi:hypothetical protein